MEGDGEGDAFMVLRLCCDLEVAYKKKSPRERGLLDKVIERERERDR